MAPALEDAEAIFGMCRQGGGTSALFINPLLENCSYRSSSGRILYTA